MTLLLDNECPIIHVPKPEVVETLPELCPCEIPPIKPKRTREKIKFVNCLGEFLHNQTHSKYCNVPPRGCV